MKYIIYLTSFIFLLSCSRDYEEFILQTELEDIELNYYLDKAIDAAYKTHLWMSEENMCGEYECCWEYVPQYLREKYESKMKLSIEEKEGIITALETSPSYIDTLDEYDEFYLLYCYKKYGANYFRPNQED